tara:strand:+ start:365 stop:520 length:156 start_codon:yes stop_codon:yes gene_type:complete
MMNVFMVAYVAWLAEGAQEEKFHSCYLRLQMVLTEVLNNKAYNENVGVLAL